MSAVQISGFQIPSFRAHIARESKAENNFLIRVWGGLGDIICAEPTVRYALKRFKGARITLATDYPAFFSHLDFYEVLPLRAPELKDYLVFDTMASAKDLRWEFASHMLTNCVDFPALCAFSRQLPVSDKEIMCHGIEPKSYSYLLKCTRTVFIHAGKHWETKTFPKNWWDGVIKQLAGHGCVPVLIGDDVDENRGTVDVDTEFCQDLRGKLTLTQTVWLLQRAKVLLTNDSAPLHFAASQDPNDLNFTGHAHIGFFATCKHPDFISHWRKGRWAYRMKNLALGGAFDELNDSPGQAEEVQADKSKTDILEWLPPASEVAHWAIKIFER